MYDNIVIFSKILLFRGVGVVGLINGRQIGTLVTNWLKETIYNIGPKKELSLLKSASNPIKE